MPTRVTMSTNSKTTTHEIDMRGLAGAIFWCIVAACITFVVGYSTPGWYISRTGSSSFGNINLGVWERCVCSDTSGSTDWQAAVQAMTTIGLIALIAALICAGVYIFVHNFSKNTILILLLIFCFGASFFILIGVIIFGVKMGDSPGDLHYSFAFTIIGAILSFVAGVLTAVQMSKSGLCC